LLQQRRAPVDLSLCTQEEAAGREASRGDKREEAEASELAGRGRQGQASRGRVRQGEAGASKRRPY
jgi:hypothetical protein